MAQEVSVVGVVTRIRHVNGRGHDRQMVVAAIVEELWITEGDATSAV